MNKEKKGNLLFSFLIPIPVWLVLLCTSAFFLIKTDIDQSSLKYIVFIISFVFSLFISLFFAKGKSVLIVIGELLIIWLIPIVVFRSFSANCVMELFCLFTPFSLVLFIKKVMQSKSKKDIKKMRRKYEKLYKK